MQNDEWVEAWTGLTPDQGYVGFINIAKVGEQVRILLRPESNPDCAKTVELLIPRDDAFGLFMTVVRHLIHGGNDAE